MVWGTERETYSADLAEGQGDDVGNQNDGAANDEGDGRADVELVGPERQHEVGRDVGFLVDAEGVGRDAEHGQTHQERQRRGAHAGAVDGAEGAHLGLEVEVLGVALDGRGRALGTAVGAAALLHVLYRVFFLWCVDRRSTAREKVGESRRKGVSRWKTRSSATGNRQEKTNKNRTRE